MNTRNLIKRAIYGLIISEFIMQAFFLTLSICLGEVIFSSAHPFEKGLLHDFIMQFTTFAVLGLVMGVIYHFYSEKIKDVSSGKKQLKIIISAVYIVAIAIIVIFGARGIIEGTSSFISILFKGGTVLLVLGVLFVLAYLVASPILNRIDKECVEQLNRKLSENR